MEFSKKWKINYGSQTEIHKDHNNSKGDENQSDTYIFPETKVNIQVSYKQLNINTRLCDHYKQ